MGQPAKRLRRATAMETGLFEIRLTTCVLLFPPWLIGHPVWAQAPQPGLSFPALPLVGVKFWVDGLPITLWRAQREPTNAEHLDSHQVESTFNLFMEFVPWPRVR